MLFTLKSLHFLYVKEASQSKTDVHDYIYGTQHILRKQANFNLMAGLNVIGVTFHTGLKLYQVVCSCKVDCFGFSIKTCCQIYTFVRLYTLHFAYQIFKI